MVEHTPDVCSCPKADAAPAETAAPLAPETSDAAPAAPPAPEAPPKPPVPMVNCHECGCGFEIVPLKDAVFKCPNCGILTVGVERWIGPAEDFE